jgi:NAD(P)H-dependent FMN reductase
VREARQGIRAARFVARKLGERGHEVTLVDPKEAGLPLLDKRYKDYDEGTAPEAMASISRTFRAADAFAFVSAEYNHGLPPAMKNLIDHFGPEEYARRPAGIVTYSAGPFGGVRAAGDLRITLGTLGLVTVPAMFPISKVSDAFDENGGTLDDAYDRRIEKFLDELEWYAGALKAAR